MFTEFSCVGTHPTLLSAPLVFSCAFFFGLYVPPYAGALIQPGACFPQSLYGTPSRPTVQSRRGSTGARFVEVKLALLAFHVGSDNASGSPAASTRKKFTRFCD